MKTNIILTTFLAVASMLALPVANAAPAAASAGGAAGVRAPQASTPAAGQPAPTSPVVPGPTLPVRTIPNPPSTIISGTNAPIQNPAALSNQAAMNSNGIASSNQFGAEGTNEELNEELNERFAARDQAVTASDRALLQTLHQIVHSAMGTTAQTGAPVHFFIDNGTVTVVGTVENDAERAGILADVQQTPGVLRVYNDLHVGANAGLRPRRGNFFAAQNDHAFSASDQALLTTVQQEAAAQLGINGMSGTQMPVHFSIQNGVVGVTGQVNSPQEKAALLADIQRTPGVTRVVDNVVVIGGTAPNAVAPENPESNERLFPTSRENETNRMLMNTTTNSSGF